jgi:hypothetical protein
MHRVSCLDVDAFREVIGTMSLYDLGCLLSTVNSCGLRYRLFKEINPAEGSELLDRLPYSWKAESLKYMPNEQRRQIVQTWSQQKTLDELDRLKEWQNREDFQWPNGLADTRVVTGRLPDHYPRNMDECAVCRKSYLMWESIGFLSCGRHSRCVACNIDEGYCCDCDE